MVENQRNRYRLSYRGNTVFQPSKIKLVSVKKILSTTVTANVAIVAAIDWNQKTFSIMKLVKGTDFIDYSLA